MHTQAIHFRRSHLHAKSDSPISLLHLDCERRRERLQNQDQCVCSFATISSP
uniref:Uncharacterized protein n=1 Tax=Anguilla anguilla TaxID=7936 RepID=A0A0E9T6M2_ANGAN